VGYKKENYYFIPTYSLESCVGDFEPRVDDPLEKIIQEDYEDKLIDNFDGIEKDIVSMAMEGYNLHQISQILGIKLSKIYKIKKTLASKIISIKEENLKPSRIKFLENLLFLYLLTQRRTDKEKNEKLNEKEIYDNWEKDTILKEYKRPPYNIFEAIIGDIKNYFNQNG